MANVEGSIYRVENGVAVPYANLGGGGGGGATNIPVETGTYTSDYTINYGTSSSFVVAEVFGCVTQLTLVLQTVTDSFTKGITYTLAQLSSQTHRDILSVRHSSAYIESVCNASVIVYRNAYYMPLEIPCEAEISYNGNINITFGEDLNASAEPMQFVNIRINAIFINRRSSSGSAINLGDLGNVTLTSPTAGQGLVYDATTQKWINGNVGGGGSSALNDLSDVVISSPEYGQSLVYDNGSQKWINGLPQVIRRFTNPTSPSSLPNTQQSLQMFIYGRHVHFTYKLIATSSEYTVTVNSDYSYSVFPKTDAYDTPVSQTWGYPILANLYLKDEGYSGAVVTPISGDLYYDGNSKFQLRLNESVTVLYNKSIVVVGSFINSAL